MSYNNPRIKMEMSMMDCMLAMAEGNPGAIRVLTELVTGAEKIDPDSALGPLGLLFSLDNLDCYGPRIWMFYKTDDGHHACLQHGIHKRPRNQSRHRWRQGCARHSRLARTTQNQIAKIRNREGAPVILRAVDVETCGLPPDDGQVVEVGWTDLKLDTSGVWRIGLPSWTFVNPQRPIPAVASSIHHIIDEDVKDAPTLDDAIAGADLVRDDIFAYIAHRAKFEQAVLPLGDVKWICSWKVAVTLAPNAPSHSLQALRYFLKLDVNRDLASPPHRAGADTYVTAALIARALIKMTPEQMAEISAKPILLPKWAFGKFMGKPFEEADSGYLEWVLKNITDDEDVIHTTKHHLALRREASRSRSPVQP